MKKITVLLLALALSFGFTLGCGKQSEEPAPEEGTNVEEPAEGAEGVEGEFEEPTE